MVILSWKPSRTGRLRFDLTCKLTNWPATISWMPVEGTGLPDHVCSDSPCPDPKSHKGNIEAGPGWHWEHSGFVSQMRSAEFSKPPSFKRVAGQYAQPIPQMKTTSLSYPLPQSKTLSLPAKALHHTNILGMIVQNKPWHEMWRNARGPWRTVSQQRPYPAREK